jgi:glycosyl transferase, family 25
VSDQACPIFLINLDRDLDRLAVMRGALDGLGLAFERVPAVLGLAMPAWVRPYFLNPDGTIASTLRRGEVGCYASHLVVARRIVDDAIPFALVLEDDLALPADFPALLPALIAAAPPGWDIIRLSNPPKTPYVPLLDLPGGCEIATYLRVPNNTGASLLSMSGAKKLLAPGVRDLQIDEHLRRPWMLEMETYGVVPAPVRSNIFEGSTIDALESRGLGVENALNKLVRRRFDPPAMLFAQIRWQIAHLGAIGWLRAILTGLGLSLARKVTGRKSGAEAQRRYRLSRTRK